MEISLIVRGEEVLWIVASVNSMETVLLDWRSGEQALWRVRGQCKVFFIECHFRIGNAAGTTLMHAYEAMLMEVGLYGNILGLDYNKYKVLATDVTCFKILWQYARHLCIGIVLH